jgi:tetratricopeptide (TPR) repeat protein
VLRAAEERGWLDLVWQLAETLTALFYNQRHLADWYDSGTRGAAAARACGRADVEARLWLLTSRPMLDLARFEEADQALDRAHELAEELGSDLLMGSVWEFRGLRLEGSDPEAAIAAYELSIQFKTTAKRDRGVALSRFLLGSLLAAHGRASEAIDLLTRARETFTGLGDERFAARALGVLGSAYLNLGDDAQAAVLLEQAVRQLAERHAYHYEAQFLEELAAVRERRDDPAGARACLERAVEIHRMFGSGRAELLQARLAGRSSDPQ